MLLSELDTLFAPPAELDLALDARWLRNDLLQLAHYQRLLESCGRASRLGRWGGIVGREERLVWYDLDLPKWQPSEYIEDPPDRPLSTMELYDLEFAYRLSVIEASLLHLEDPASPLLAEPIAVKECDGCGWQDWCFERMEASGDLSLLPGMTVAKRRKYLARGVTTLDDLASLDSATARLVAAGSRSGALEGMARTADPSTPVTDLLAGRPKQASDWWKRASAPRPMWPAPSVDRSLRRCGPERPPPADRQRPGPHRPVTRLPPARGRPGRRAPGRHRGRRRHGERERGLLPLGHPAQRPR